MGVDAGLFDLMVREGKDSIYVLSGEELKSLSVVNNGRQSPSWSIEVVPGGQYLQGTQRTVYGMGKIAFQCTQRNLSMYSVYEMGAEKATSVVKGEWVHSILVDSDTLPLSQPTYARVAGQYVQAIFSLSTGQATRISMGRSVGHAMQVNRDAPTFVGYVVDIPRDSTAKVKLFIENCLMH
jgi:hypothetical protein